MKLDSIECANLLVKVDKEAIGEKLLGKCLETIIKESENRIKLLEKTILNGSKNDIKQTLYDYLLKNLTIRDKTPEEIKEEYDAIPIHLKKIYRIKKYILTDESDQIIRDVALLFANYFKKKYPKLQWGMVEPLYANYGEISLSFVGQEKYFTPFRVITTVAVKIFNIDFTDEVKHMFWLNLWEAWEESFVKMVNDPKRFEPDYPKGYVQRFPPFGNATD